MRAHKWTIALLLALMLIGGGGIFLWQTGFFAAATSLEGIQAYIVDFSPYSQLVFFLVQLVSAIIAPIPSNITAAAGALLFGMWQSFFLTWMAVSLGSLIVFALARTLGQAFVSRFVSEKVSGRYLDLIKRKRDTFLSLTFLFPFFPDDLICILAGLTDVGYLRFLAIVTLFRPWGLLVACAVGSAAIRIPLWGMALIGVVGVLLFLVGLKYGDRISETLLERMKKNDT